MDEEAHYITNKRKTAQNEWENGDSDFLRALYSVYKNQDNSFPILTFKLVNRKINQFY